MKKTIEQQYIRKSQKEHILFRPDMYMGSVVSQKQRMWVLDSTKEKLIEEEVEFNPGLYKIFDEVLVNSGDNLQRDKRMNEIRVEVGKQEVSVWNNGKGLPVVRHHQENMWVVELVFGHLLTSSNYDDQEKKVTGGRNGLGAKLTNIFSKRFEVETVDSNVRKRLAVSWKDNMSHQSKVEVDKSDQKDYTKVTFAPDFPRFGLTGFTPDMLRVMEKRVYDLAGILPEKVSVYFNGKRILNDNFQKYVQLYLEDQKRIILAKKNRWEVIIALSDLQFKQVSFVNNINTHRGGTHVEYILDQVCEVLLTLYKKKYKNNTVTKQQMKQQLWVFVNCQIENPVFDSQTKESLKSHWSSFGSECEADDIKELKQLVDWGLFERVNKLQHLKDSSKMNRINGKKSEKVVGVAKLEDANWAGTKQGHKCTLILTEGDSAKCLAMSGVEVLGRDTYGVFPLKGKLLNVREVHTREVCNNQELKNILTILGLKFNQQYTNCQALRYGHIMIMTDQDTDGSHIKALLINFLQYFWPSLLEIPGFLNQFITPLIKVRKGQQCHSFFTSKQFQEWFQKQANQEQWKVKYYKGLGTSTHQEAKEYFKNYNDHQRVLEYKSSRDDEVIDLVFNKTRAQDRKDWINRYQGDSALQVPLDYSQKYVQVDHFINKELILFSITDNIRSLPSIMDGLKPCQRKVLFSCFKKNLKEEIKLSQLAGYISENAAYHHGENSLMLTIIKLAQDFVGTNNVNLLQPIGQFGSRALGGEDHASPRYIYTNLSTLARTIFNPLDEHLLDYLEDEGQSIEPLFYLPIMPMVLVNGANGTGTGWSTSVLQYDPLQIAQVLIQRLSTGHWPHQVFLPYYQGYQGHIALDTHKKDSECDQFIIQGVCHEYQPDCLEILELPLFKWTTNYKQFLESRLKTSKGDDNQDIEDIKEEHSHNQVVFRVRFQPGRLDELRKLPGGILRNLKLSTSTKQTNMVMFDHSQQIYRYHTVYDILKQFYQYRLPYYHKRKVYQLSKIKREIVFMQNKLRFIQEFLEQKISFLQNSTQEIIEQMSKSNYVKYQDLPKILSTKHKEKEEQKEYDYLLSIQLMQLSKDNHQKMKSQLDKLAKEYETIDSINQEQMWMQDLQHFVQLYKQFRHQADNRQNDKQRQKIEQIKKQQGMYSDQQVIQTDHNNNAMKKQKEQSDNKNIDNTQEKSKKKQNLKEKVNTKEKKKNIKTYVISEDEDDFINDSESESVIISSSSSGWNMKNHKKKEKQEDQNVQCRSSPRKARQRKIVISEDEQDIEEQNQIEKQQEKESQYIKSSPRKVTRRRLAISDDENNLQDTPIKKQKQKSTIKLQKIEEEEKPSIFSEQILQSLNTQQKENLKTMVEKKSVSEEFLHSLPLKQKIELKKQLQKNNIQIQPITLSELFTIKNQEKEESLINGKESSGKKLRSAKKIESNNKESNGCKIGELFNNIVIDLDEEEENML